ncbi:MAG TPA: exopolysaccharide biosynthesis protein, partial [Caulobacteraceae bacterium]|nr:exopolysaccharide biosynthesis protein [Caulobacteraceae bacterium]
IRIETLRTMLSRFIPPLQRIEHWSKPRLLFLFGPIGDRLIGIVCTLLAFVLILPIPLGNLMPAFTIGTLALALFQRDGVIALLGYASAAISLGLLILSAGAVTVAVHRLAHWIGL